MADNGCMKARELSVAGPSPLLAACKRVLSSTRPGARSSTQPSRPCMVRRACCSKARSRSGSGGTGPSSAGDCDSTWAMVARRESSPSTSKDSAREVSRRLRSWASRSAS